MFAPEGFGVAATLRYRRLTNRFGFMSAYPPPPRDGESFLDAAAGRAPSGRAALGRSAASWT